MKSDGAWLARRADAIVVGVSDKAYTEVTRSIDALEREAIGSAANATNARDTKRRIGDLRLMVAVLKKRPPRECTAFLKTRAALGYESLYVEALNVGMLARHCVGSRATKIGQTVLAEFLSKVDHFAPKSEQIPTELVKELRRLMTRLSKRSS